MYRLSRLTDLTDFGGATGAPDNGTAFKAAFEALRAAGGGTLVLGPGVWNTGPIELFSGTTLALEKGAVLSFIPEMDRYTPEWTRWEGIECYAMHPCIFSRGQTGVTITGEGRIEGNGAFWWRYALEKKARLEAEPETVLERRLAALNPGYQGQPGGGGGRRSQFLRPPLVQFLDCDRVRIEGVTLAGSPFWTVHPVYCSDVTLSELTIKNPRDAPNTDGIDIDSCNGVLIEDCVINVGDDGIALKSGSGPDGLRVGKPTSNVEVRRCMVGDGHGGIVIGSETAGGISGVKVSDCVFKGSDRGIRIKTRRGRGGVIRDLEFRNLVMEGTLCPLVINMYYRCGASPEDGWFSLDSRPIEKGTPEIHGVTVRNIQAAGCRASAGFIAGLPESPVRGLSVVDCFFSTDETSPASAAESDMYFGIPEVNTKAFRMLNADNPRFENCSVEGPAVPFIYG